MTRWMIDSWKKTRIVVVDSFLVAPGEVREQALAAKFEEHPDRHKGKRGEEMPIPKDVGDVLCSLVGKKRVTNGYCAFQLCVAGDQRVYHSDAQQWAAIVYLTPDAPVDGGTSFYRSRKTGVYSGEEIEARLALQMYSPIEHDTYAGKLLDRTAWEEVDRIGNVWNRLVVWNARLVHSVTEYFGSTPENGRLFLMFFFDTERAD